MTNTAATSDMASLQEELSPSQVIKNQHLLKELGLDLEVQEEIHQITPPYQVKQEMLGHANDIKIVQPTATVEKQIPKSTSIFEVNETYEEVRKQVHQAAQPKNTYIPRQLSGAAPEEIIPDVTANTNGGAGGGYEPPTHIPPTGSDAYVGGDDFGGDFGGDLGGNGGFDPDDIPTRMFGEAGGDPRSNAENVKRTGVRTVSVVATEILLEDLYPRIVSSFAKSKIDVSDDDELPFKFRNKITDEVEAHNNRMHANSELPQDLISKWRDSLTKILDKKSANIEVPPEIEFAYANGHIILHTMDVTKKNARDRDRLDQKITGYLDEIRAEMRQDRIDRELAAQKAVQREQERSKKAA